MRKIYIFIARALLCSKKRESPSRKLPEYFSLFANLAALSDKEIRLEKLKRRRSKYTLLILLFCCFTTILYAQQLPEPNRLVIGDKVPDLVLSNIINYKDSSIRLAQLRGKAVILDFWATYCSACLKEFPKIDSLQRQYSKNLQILLMNAYLKDSETVLANFLKEQKVKLEGFSLPLVKNSNEIHKVFPIKSMPHYIWIGTDGRIKAITRADQVTHSNIERLIAGLSLNLKLKKD